MKGKCDAGKGGKGQTKGGDGYRCGGVHYESDGPKGGKAMSATPVDVSQSGGAEAGYDPKTDGLMSMPVRELIQIHNKYQELGEEEEELGE